MYDSNISRTSEAEAAVSFSPATNCQLHESDRIHKKFFFMLELSLNFRNKIVQFHPNNPLCADSLLTLLYC